MTDQIAPSLRRLDRYPVLFLFTVFLSALPIALAVPLFSLYVVDGLGRSAIHVTIVIASLMTLTVLANRYFGRKIDEGAQVRPLLVLTVVADGLGFGLQAIYPGYWSLIILGIPLWGIGAASVSLFMTAGRLFAEKTEREPLDFNAYVRMAITLGWIIGPAAGFTIYGLLDFEIIFYLSFALKLACAGCVLLLFPRNFTNHNIKDSDKERADHKVPNALVVACVPVFLLFACNSLFVSAAPLYFLGELNLPTSTPGLAFAVKCIVEMLVIYYIAAPARRFGERRMIMLSGIFGGMFFLSITQVTSVEAAILFSGLEGLYYGIVAGIGLTFIQSYAPKQTGVATAWFSNALFGGGLAGSLVFGTLGTITSYQSTIFYCSFIALSAFIITIAIRDAAPAPSQAAL
ncbi:MFS transporter [Rhodobacteraceae bacterium RKSG542]|uniref:MFS transporter n=1 Tax=Pseudovibrio flavus TaxID=2529854 RepID=UPI0012BC975A|nr:MFS transporter [Pseudovibrio flavus]MTI19192.1 MFS transporter [Pseudovibrio flavus]